MKENRVLSFLIVILIYILSGGCGITLFNFLSFDLWLNLLICDITSTIIVFIFSLIFKNASIYDPYWSVQPIVIVLSLGIKYGFNYISVLPLLAILFWGIRLTLNWAYTFNNLNHQDWRYTMLKEKTNKLYPLVNFFGIHLFPTLVVYLCVLPVCYLFIKGSEFNILLILLFIVSVVATIIQLIADKQMHQFRKNRPTTFIKTGLWKYSRHPNYLGEILMWWGIALFCIIALQNYYFLISGALVNTLMFIFISIPMAEKHQSSRKEGFDQYKKETRMLLPFKK